jgi:hypothetical protein
MKGGVRETIAPSKQQQRVAQSTSVPACLHQAPYDASLCLSQRSQLFRRAAVQLPPPHKIDCRQNHAA